MQMSRLMVWSTAFSDDERSETEYRLSEDEPPLTLSGLPPENRDNSRDNIRTNHFIIAKIHIFTQRSKRNQHRNRRRPARRYKEKRSRSAGVRGRKVPPRGASVDTNPKFFCLTFGVRVRLEVDHSKASWLISLLPHDRNNWRLPGARRKHFA